MNNFTPRAQQVLALARKEADRFNHTFVGAWTTCCSASCRLGARAWSNIEKERPTYVVILAGDHVYKMDYLKLVEQHIEPRPT